MGGSVLDNFVDLNLFKVTLGLLPRIFSLTFSLTFPRGSSSSEDSDDSDGSEGSDGVPPFLSFGSFGSS